MKLEQPSAIHGSRPVQLTLIAAISLDRVLAVEGRIPWSLPRDVAHFRQQAAGQWLLLGRTTYSQMKHWFQPDQVPVVVTHQKDFPVPGGFAVDSVQAARGLAASHESFQLLVCGGASLYEQTLPLASHLILTCVEVHVRGDRFFPDWPLQEWQLDRAESHAADESNPHPMTFQWWSRIGDPA